MRYRAPHDLADQAHHAQMVMPLRMDFCVLLKKGLRKKHIGGGIWQNRGKPIISALPRFRKVMMCVEGGEARRVARALLLHLAAHDARGVSATLSSASPILAPCSLDRSSTARWPRPSAMMGRHLRRIAGDVLLVGHGHDLAPPARLMATVCRLAMAVSRSWLMGLSASSFCLRRWLPPPDRGPRCRRCVPWRERWIPYNPWRRPTFPPMGSISSG